MKKNHPFNPHGLFLASVLLLAAAFTLAEVCCPREADCARAGVNQAVGQGAFGSWNAGRELAADQIYTYFGTRDITSFFARLPLMKISSSAKTPGMRMPLSLRAHACRSLSPTERDFGAFEFQRTDPYKSLSRTQVVPLLTIQGNLDACFLKFRTFMQRIGRNEHGPTGEAHGLVEFQAGEKPNIPK